MIYIAGPGHGGPALVANVYLEGTYTEVYPEITENEDGMFRLFRQFSTPGGIPSHVSAPTPGSIHEGGELGYALVHAFGAAFDNPDLIVACVIGDGEAETGPLEGSWKGVRFLNPVHDGAVLPILHLNEFKISGPTVLGRTDDEDVAGLLRAHGYDPVIVRGSDPEQMHPEFASVLDAAHTRIREIQDDARSNGFSTRPRWPAIVLRTPKGWTGPDVVDGVQVLGHVPRAPGAPLGDAGERRAPRDARGVDAQLRARGPVRREGRARLRAQELAPEGDRRMGANPHANGGKRARAARHPRLRGRTRSMCRRPRRCGRSRRVGSARCCATSTSGTQTTFRLFCPDETLSNRLGAVFEVENRCTMDPIGPYDDHISHDGRVMEVLSEHNCEGWLEGYLLSGRHGLFATYEAFAMVPVSMAVQHAKWLGECRHHDWRASVASLNVLLTSTCWRNDHNGFSHQGPGFIDSMLSMRGVVTRVYLPPDANCLLSVADHCFRSRDYVNCIVIDKQPQLQWLDLDAAREHCAQGASRWEWASTDDPEGETDPDIVLACAGDVPTLETVAAASLIRKFVPDLTVRVVNVVDLTVLFPRKVHPHGMSNEEFVRLFTADADVTVRVPRLRPRPPPDPARAAVACPLPCPRLLGAGHDDDTVRHGRLERPQPLPPRGIRRAPHPCVRAGHRGSARPLQRDARSPPHVCPRKPRRHARGARLGLDGVATPRTRRGSRARTACAASVTCGGGSATTAARTQTARCCRSARRSPRRH